MKPPRIPDAIRAAKESFPASDPERDVRIRAAIASEWALRRLDRASFPAEDPARNERSAGRLDGALARRRELVAAREGRTPAHRGHATSRHPESSLSSRRPRRRTTASGFAWRFAGGAAATLACAIAAWVVLNDDRGWAPTRVALPVPEGTAGSDGATGPRTTPPTPHGDTPRQVDSALAATARFERSVASATAAGDVRALEALLETNPLHAERERLALALIELVPDHATSREILGHVMHRGRWIPRDELLSLGSDDRDELASWLPPEIEFSRRIATAGRDPREWWSLHEWCAAKGLAREALDCAQRVLALDADHEWARLSVGQIRYEGRWVLREDIARIDADSTGGTSPAMLTAWAEFFATEPLATSTDRVEVWVQRPAQGAIAAELERGLGEIARRLDRAAHEFIERNPDAMGGVGAAGGANAAGGAGRLRVAVYTQADDYRGMCSGRDLVMAQDQAGMVVGNRTIALSPALVALMGGIVGRPAESRPSGEALFYDDFLVAACEADAPPERRVLWQAVLEAQERLAQPVVMAMGKRFVVVAAAAEAQAQALAKGAAAKLDELVARMDEDGLLLGRAFDRRYAVVMTSGAEAWREAVARCPSKTPHQACWAGSYEPTRGLLIADSSYIETLLHGGAWIALHHAAGRLAGDGDLYWLHEGLAHFAAGRVLDPVNAVHPRWGPALARMLEQGGAGIPLVQLIDVERAKLLGSKAYAKREALDLVQAQSWALVHYLMRGSDRAARGRLVGWWTSVATHGGGYDSFRRHLVHSDTARLEREIQQHLRSITQ